MIPLKSSWLAGLEHHEDGTLVVYLRNGKSYTHPDQPPERVAAFLAAESPGEFYNRYLRHRRPKRQRPRRRRFRWRRFGRLGTSHF
jgi:hypothetical protein